MTQFALTRDTRNALARRLSLDFMDPLFKRDIADKIERLAENGAFPGIEHYLPIVSDAVLPLNCVDGIKQEELAGFIARLRTRSPRREENGGV